MEGYFWWSQMGKGYVLAFSGHKPEVLNVLQCLGKFQCLGKPHRLPCLKCQHPLTNTGE